MASLKGKKLNEHLDPKYTYAQLQFYTLRNHQKAVNFYLARKKNFLNNFEAESKKLSEKIEKEIEDNDIFSSIIKQKLLEVFPTTGKNTVYNRLFEIQNAQNPKAYINELETKHELPEGIKPILEAWGEDTNGQYNEPFWKYFFMKIGKIFEEQVIKDVFKAIGQEYGGFLKEITDNMYNLGSEKSTSTVTKDSKMIRVDWMYMAKDKRSLRKTGTGSLKYNGLDIELQKTFDLKDIKEDLIRNSILKKYIEKNDMYGFSIKAWSKKTLQGGRTPIFSESSIMRANIQKVFEQLDSGGYRHTWEPTYAAYYTSYFLSRNLISIISPSTVAFILGDGVYWMSDFLLENRFFMDVYLDKMINYDRHKKVNSEYYASSNKNKDKNIYYIKSHSGKTLNSTKATSKKEGEPNLRDSNILIKNYIEAHGEAQRDLFTSQLNKAYKMNSNGKFKLTKSGNKKVDKNTFKVTLRKR